MHSGKKSEPLAYSLETQARASVKAEFSRPALDFIDAPTALDASGALGVHSTEGRCVFFFDGV